MQFAIGLLAVVAITGPMPSTRADSQVYHSNYQNKSGFFFSPNYPYSYDDDRPVRTYNFYGKNNELVQIVFDNFDLPRGDPNERCGKTSPFLLYKRENRFDIYLCGPERPLPILSEKSSFILEYRYPRDAGNIENGFRGFNASFKFVSNYGIESGIQEDHDSCEFLFNSEDAQNGTVNSPNFPGPYPRNKKFVYVFRGTEKYLKLNFTEFNLLGSTRCSVAEDVLELTETVDRDPLYFQERRCGQLDTFNLTVNASTFYLIFTSSSNNVPDSVYSEPRPFIGFRAYYEFTNDTSSSPCVLGLPESSIHLLSACLCLITSSWLSLRFT